MKHLDLQGWNIGISRVKLMERGNNGEPKEVDGWALVFTENIPNTGDTITFRMSRGVRDYVVAELTGGIVLAGGELPQI